MARSYTIKTAYSFICSTDTVRYADIIQYQVCDAVTTVVSSRNPFTGITADQTKIVRTPQGSVQETTLVTDSRAATDAEIRSHLDGVVGV